MEEQGMNIKFSGWSAAAVIVVLIVAVGIRMVMVNKKVTDSKLMERIRFELMTTYLPDDVEKMKQLHASGEVAKLSDAVASLATTRINVKSVKVSRSIFDFSIKKRDVVVKIDYAIFDENGIRNKGIKYYRFIHTPVSNRWEFRGNSSSTSYYLKFF